jgi:HEAT repeat protein
LLNDPDPIVRRTAAVALTKLGDPAGQDIIQRMLASPVADVRMMAVEADRSITPAKRLSILVPILHDEEPLNRIKAAELLMTEDPTQAKSVLVASCRSPILRFGAGRGA